MKFLTSLVENAKAQLKNRDLHKALLFVALMAIGTQAHAGASTIATELQTSVSPYLNLGLKLFGAMIALGGLIVAFNGFTGRDEGFDKVFKLGTGFIGIALGIVCITKTAVIITWLNLSNAFSTV